MIRSEVEIHLRAAEDANARTRQILAECATLIEQLRQPTARLNSRLEPGDPGPIATEPQVREPRMPWSSPPTYTPKKIVAQLPVDPVQWAWDHDDEFVRYVTQDRPVSIRPLLTWALVIFLAGTAFGAVCSTVFHLTSAVEPTAARADVPRGVVATHRPGEPEIARSNRAEGAARATSHADATTSAASEEAQAPQPTVLTTPTPEERLRDDPPVSTVRAAPVSRYSRADIEAMSRSAAIRHGLDPDRFAALVFCESSFRSDALGAAGERGPAQFKQPTFDWFTRLSGLPYVPSDIDDPERNIELAAWANASGLSSHWTCAR